MIILTLASEEAFGTNQNSTKFELATANIVYLTNSTALLGKTDESNSDSYQAKIVSGVIVFGCILGFILFAVVMSHLCCNRGYYQQQSQSEEQHIETTGKGCRGLCKEPLTNQEILSSVVVST